MKTYADSASWAKVPNPPTEAELKPAFKQAYKESLLASPSFGGQEGLSSRQWWVRTVKRALELCDPPRLYSDTEFSRFFRRVYQHYGSPRGYERLADADALLSWLQAEAPDVVLGITSNTPARTMETVLPLIGLHDHFDFFVCSQDVGEEKPAPRIFDEAFEQAKFWIQERGGPDAHAPLQKCEVLHIGDSLESDYCGAKAYGFQALVLDRSGNAKVTQYQDWLEGPDYAGKSEEDIKIGTVRDMHEVIDRLRHFSE